MGILLTAGAGTLAALSFRLPHIAYVWIIGCVILALTALPGFLADEPMPDVALWRTIATTFGVAVEALVVSLVFPVTAR